MPKMKAIILSGGLLAVLACGCDESDDGGDGNTAPVAFFQLVTTNQNAAAGITLAGSDVDGDSLSWVVDTQPSHGALTGAAPSLTYTPETDYYGPDAFTFHVSDGKADSAAATVAVTVNAIPLAYEQVAGVLVNTPRQIILVAEDLEGDSLTWVLDSQPAHGTLAGTAPDLTYSPDTDYQGKDSLGFHASDGKADSAVAVVRIVVQNVLYVDIDASGEADGSSWADAFTRPADAADAAVAGHEIWVAEGTYEYPGAVTTGEAMVQLKDGMSVYGGFVGTESLLSERGSPGDHPTVLDGMDIVRHVVGGADGARLDGFTVTMGLGGYYEGDGGGGMINVDVVDVTVENCVFVDNRSNEYGGAMLNTRSTVTLANCEFANNVASRDSGGAVRNRDSAVVMTDCTFVGNEAKDFSTGRGGAVYNLGGSCTMTRCAFVDNLARYVGGAVYSYECSLVLDACAFVGNWGYGGALYNSGLTSFQAKNCCFAGNRFQAIRVSGTLSSIINSTFCGNTALTSPGGAFRITGGETTLTNCVLWGNMSSDGSQIDADAAATVTVSYSLVEGGYAGAGNVDADPFFVDPGYWDDNSTPANSNDDFWVNGDHHPMAGSPCIDAADGDAAPVADIEGNGRYDDPGTEPNSGVGPVDYVDMGAYEYQGP